MPKKSDSQTPTDSVGEQIERALHKSKPKKKKKQRKKKKVWRSRLKEREDDSHLILK